MKTTFPFILMFFIFFSATAQIVNIPDPVFKQALLGQGVDTNFDEEIQVSEAEAVTGHLDVNGQFFDIYDMTGIEAFVNITELTCGYNELTALDLSQNTQLTYLDCVNNPLATLSISQCTLLEVLFAEDTQLTSIDLSNNVNLKYFSISHAHISNLDLTQNNNLDSIGFSEIEELTTVDIRNGGNNNIILFGSHNNPNLTCIFVDDSEYMETNFGGTIDPHSHFVETQAECDALGVNENEFHDAQIYPNPVTNILYIAGHFNDLTQDSKLIITDILGKKVFESIIYGSNAEVNVSQLQKGLYFLLLKTAKTQQTIKFLKI